MMISECPEGKRPVETGPFWSFSETKDKLFPHFQAPQASIYITGETLDNLSQSKGKGYSSIYM